jgi:hypothetical protein
MTGGRADGRTVGVMLALALLAVGPSARLPAQDTTRVTPSPPDTTHQVRPMGAFWRSLLLPGWGQAATGRHTTGSVLVAWEGVTAMMTLKAQQEATYMKDVGSPNLRAKRQEVQDWLVLWIFNHLFAGAEAYVSGHLQDFPADLRIQAVPRGIGISLPLP